MVEIGDVMRKIELIEFWKIRIEELRATLPVVLQKVVQSFFFEGCKIDDLAKEMGLTVGDVSTHIDSAVKRMAKMLIASCRNIFNETLEKHSWIREIHINHSSYLSHLENI